MYDTVTCDEIKFISEPQAKHSTAWLFLDDPMSTKFVHSNIIVAVFIISGYFATVLLENCRIVNSLVYTTFIPPEIDE